MEVDIEYLKISLPFAGALLGSMIGTPFVEWFKDKLNAKRRWEERKAEIVATIRLIIGSLSAFAELQEQAYGGGARPEKFSEAGKTRLLEFSFSILDENLSKLSSLHPDDSKSSAIAQRLIQRLVVLRTYLAQVREMTPITVTNLSTRQTALSISRSDREILEEYKKEFEDLQIFLGGLYAPRLGIDRLSLVVDQEILHFEVALQQRRINEAEEKWREAEAKRQELQEQYARDDS